MPSGKMDEKAAERIAKARGKNDQFAKRADMAARNNRDRAGSSSDADWRRDGSGQRKTDSSKQK